MSGYNLVNKDVIHNGVECESKGQAFIYEKAFPSEPLKPIIFHIIGNTENVELQANLIIKEYGTQGISMDQVFTIDLKRMIIGSYFLAGLIYDNIIESDDFFKDLKEGKIELSIINIDKTIIEKTAGMFIVDLIHLCKDISTPVIHIFIPEMLDKQLLNSINDSLGDKYFIKYKDEVFND